MLLLERDERMKAEGSTLVLKLLNVIDPASSDFEKLKNADYTEIVKMAEKYGLMAKG